MATPSTSSRSASVRRRITAPPAPPAPPPPRAPRPPRPPRPPPASPAGGGVEIAQRFPRHGELERLSFRNRGSDGGRKLRDDRRLADARLGDRAVHVAIGTQVLHAPHRET